MKSKDQVLLENLVDDIYTKQSKESAFIEEIQK